MSATWNDLKKLTWDDANQFTWEQLNRLTIDELMELATLRNAQLSKEDAALSGPVNDILKNIAIKVSSDLVVEATKKIDWHQALVDLILFLQQLL